MYFLYLSELMVGDIFYLRVKLHAIESNSGMLIEQLDSLLDTFRILKGLVPKSKCIWEKGGDVK